MYNFQEKHYLLKLTCQNKLITKEDIEEEKSSSENTLGPDFTAEFCLPPAFEGQIIPVLFNIAQSTDREGKLLCPSPF